MGFRFCQGDELLRDLDKKLDHLKEGTSGKVEQGENYKGDSGGQGAHFAGSDSSRGRLFFTRSWMMPFHLQALSLGMIWGSWKFPLQTTAT